MYSAYSKMTKPAWLEPWRKVKHSFEPLYYVNASVTTIRAVSSGFWKQHGHSCLYPSISILRPSESARNSGRFKLWWQLDWAGELLIVSSRQWQMTITLLTNLSVFAFRLLSTFAQLSPVVLLKAPSQARKKTKLTDFLRVLNLSKTCESSTL